MALGDTYHFRAKAVSEGTDYGDDMTFAAVTVPSVTTNDAGSVTTNSARLNGALTSKGTADNVTVTFVWGITAGGPYTQETTPSQVMTGTGAFSVDLGSLDPGVTYYYSSKAVGHGEAVYGVEKTFTTGRSPVIEGLDPRGGKRGQHLTVTISGANFDGATIVSFGSGITVEDFDVSSTEMTAEIAIDGDAEVGVRDISVTTRMGTATMAGGFAVTAGSSRLPIWVYPVAIVGGLMVLLILLAVGARLVRRLAG